MPGSLGPTNERERFFADFTRLQSLILDVIERLSILETSARFADQQRQSLIDTTAKLNERLEPFRELGASVSGIRAEVEKLKKIVDSHREYFIEIKGGIKLMKFVWWAVWAAIGSGATIAITIALKGG